MSTEPSSICGVCGNTKVNGVCPNCRKVGGYRLRRWGIGAGGGKRRRGGRQRASAAPAGTHPAVPAPAPRPVAPRPPAARPAASPAAQRSTARNLAEALDGTWREINGRVVIALDIQQGLYRSQRPDQPWSKEVQLRLGSVEGHAISFYREEERISGLLENDGLLTLMADNQLFRFVCVQREQEVRVCPNCYSRTERAHKSCPVCGWRYPKRLRPTDY